jgi:hypothetical protein
LKALGVGSLRDGVYVLPDRPEFREAFAAQQGDIAESGGTAHVLVGAGQSESEEVSLRALFDRTEQYSSLIREAEALAATIAEGSESDGRRRLRQLSRHYDGIASGDFFESPGRDRARAVLSSLGSAVIKMFSPGEPSASGAPIDRLDPAKYRKRVWATRRRIWVDRVASAWLIQRFIDPELTFRWLSDPSECPQDALGFDFDGAAFTHVGDLTTFEVLLAAFGFDRDAGLVKIAAIVHFLDIGGPPVPEAAGFEALLSGARARTEDDDELLCKMVDVLESLYEAFRP